MYGFITLPTPANVIATSGAWSTAIFDELLPPALAVVGMFIGVALVIIIWKGIQDGFNTLLERRRRSNDNEEYYEFMREKYKDDN